MEQTLKRYKPSLTEVSAALMVYAVTMLASLIFALHRPATAASVTGAGTTIALGTMVIALMVQRRSAWPPKTFLTAAAVLAASAIIGPWLGGTPALDDSARSLLWMHPWYPMVLGWAGAPRSGVCAATSPSAGPLLIGAAVALSVITWGAVALTTLL